MSAHQKRHTVRKRSRHDGPYGISGKECVCFNDDFMGCFKLSFIRKVYVRDKFSQTEKRLDLRHAFLSRRFDGNRTFSRNICPALLVQVLLVFYAVFDRCQRISPCLHRLRVFQILRHKLSQMAISRRRNHAVSSEQIEFHFILGHKMIIRHLVADSLKVVLLHETLIYRE